METTIHVNIYIYGYYEKVDRFFYDQTSPFLLFSVNIKKAEWDLWQSSRVSLAQEHKRELHFPSLLAYLAAFAARGLVAVSAPQPLVDESSRQRGVGGGAHHDLRWASGAASNLAVSSGHGLRTRHTDGLELDAFGAHAGLVQHVAGLCGDGRHAHHGVGAWAGVRLLPEFNFLPEGHE